MNDYIVIQSKKAKTCLKSARSKSKVHIMRFGNQKCELSHFIESWIATDIHTFSGRQNIARWLRQLYGDVKPDEIDEFYKNFEDEHLLEPVEYDFSLIPLIATETEYCEMNISIFKEPIFLTLQQEQEVMQLLQAPPRRRAKFFELRSWFSKYRIKYGYEATRKRDRPSQNYELAWAFCVYHGLDVTALQREVHGEATMKSIDKKEATTSTIQVVCMVIAYLSVIFLFIKWGESEDNFWLSSILLCIGWSMICVPLYLLSRRK